MFFSIRPHRRSFVQCAVTYNAGPFQGQGTIWNLSCTGGRLSGDLPLHIGQAIPLTVTLPNQPSIFVAAAIVRWKCGQKYGLETLVMEKLTQCRLACYVARLVRGQEARAETLRQVRTIV